MISLNKYSFGLLNDSKPYANQQKNIEASALDNLDLNSIIQVDFPDNQYVKEQTDKKQIILHHTVSGLGVDGDIAWWRQTVERIGTAIIIGWDGKIYQCFSSKYWAYHLGAGNQNLDKQSIGIEIDSWGGLVKYQNKWYPAKWNSNSKKYVPNISVKPIENFVEYTNGYKGLYAYEKYTNAQIKAVGQLLVFFSEKYNIPLDYNEKMWDLNNDALSGKAGIWTHTSFRSDKSDCHPQNELINILKSLK